MSVNTKMTAIADKIRSLRGVSGTMGLDAMATHLGNEITGLNAALAALTEKGVTVPDGTKVDGLAALIAAIEAGGGDVEVVTGTVTPSENVASIDIYAGISSEELSAKFCGSVYGGYWLMGDEPGESTAVYGIQKIKSLTNKAGTRIYYNGTSYSRSPLGVAMNPVSPLGPWRLYAYSATYGFIPGKTYRWFMMGEKN